MKLSKALLFFCISLAITSCKKDDSTDDTSGNDANYFPVTSGSNWTYNIDTDGQDSQEDALYVEGTEQSDGETYTNIDSEAEPFGFVTSMLVNNIVRVTNGQLLVKGQVGAPIDGFPNIMIELDNFILYDANASNGDQLSSITGAFEQEIEGIPLEFEYEFQTTKLPNTSAVAFNGFEFDDVLNTEFTLTLSVTAQIEVGGFIIPFPILGEQDVITGEASFAADTGYILSESTVDYELEDLSGLGIDLPFPSEATTLTTETMTAYQIGN